MSNNERENSILESQIDRMLERIMYDRLLRSMVNWRLEQGDRPILEMGPQTVEDWDQHAGRHPGQSGFETTIDLQKAVALQNGRYDSVFAIGRRYLDRYSPDILTFQFSFTKKNFRDESIMPDSLANKFSHLFWRGTGEFYVSHGRPVVDTWADAHEFGGKGIRNWNVDKFLSQKGIEECTELMQIVAHTVMRPAH